MPTLIAVILVVLAAIVFFALAKFVVGAIILALGVVAGLYLWNRYGRRSGSDTTVARH